MRQKYLVGNWKMNQNLAEIEQFFQDFERKLGNSGSAIIGWLLNFIHLERLIRRFSKYCQMGAQDCSQHASGAHTGEVSPLSLVDIGAVFVLVGHSERRQHQGEDNPLLCQKVLAAVAAV